MTSSEADKLNFYSKYNRVREKQDIESLYALIQTDIDRNDMLTLTLNCSRAADTPDDSPIRHYQQEKPRKEVSIIPSLQEQEEQDRLREMEEKLRKLERMERDFHEQLDRSEKEHRRKQELREVKKRQREHYRQQLINVIEHTSEHSQHSHHNSHPIPAHNQYLPEQPPQQEDEYDDYYSGGEIKLREESDFDVNETRRKLKEIIEIQRKREKEVESVQQNNDIKTSSIVIERININPKAKETVLPNPPSFVDKAKQVKNYCEVQLSHSQSANVLRNVHSVDKLQINERIPEAEEQQEPRMEYHYQDEHLHYEEVNLNYEHPRDDEEENHFDMQDEHEEEAEEDDSHIHKESDCNYEYEYEHSQGIEPPITLTQEEGNNQLTGEDGSELNEEIADHVISIGDLSEQQSQPPVHVPHRSPLFLSQAHPHPRQTLHSQHQVQSIAESIDFHPLETQLAPEAKSQIIYGGQQDGTAEPGDRKTSFKKLMAQNRANLIPRLAISTILNQHINEALGDYRHVHPPAIPVAAPLHQSIISSEGSISKPGKVNFKSVLRKNKLNSSRQEKKVVSKDPVKVQANKNLLLNFFDQN